MVSTMVFRVPAKVFRVPATVFKVQIMVFVALLLANLVKIVLIRFLSFKSLHT
jgi:hypothetical protein